jgi:hypothetical protein
MALRLAVAAKTFDIQDNVSGRPDQSLLFAGPYRHSRARRQVSGEPGNE